MSRTTFGPPRLRRLFLLLGAVLVSCTFALYGCGGNDGHRKKNPVPILTSIAPASVTAGSAPFTLTVRGLDFVVGATVLWNGAARPTTFVSASELAVTVPAADVAAPGGVQIAVLNPEPGGGTSAAANFTIIAIPPAITSLSPASAQAGGAGFDLTVNGAGFLSGAVVLWNDPAPGGGTSAAAGFQVVSAAPVLTTLDPSTLRAGAMSFALKITGSRFLPGATVHWAGEPRATTFVSDTQLVAAISSSDVARAGGVDVSVSNPAPTSGPSNALRFLVTEPPSPPPSGFPLLITVAPDGSLPDGPSVNGGMDWDGNHVIFASRASNLVPGDTNGAWDIFVRETCLYSSDGCTPATRRIVLAADGSEPDGDSGWTATDPANSLGVSFDGRHVAYISTATDLVAGDTNGMADVFLTDTCIGSRDPCTPKTIRASLHNDGAQSSLPVFDPAVADDGRYVLFVSADPAMVAGDGNGLPDVFMRDTCEGAVGACSPGTRRISVTASGGDANGTSGQPTFTGRYVAFASTASNLVADDTNGVADVFLYDTCIGAPAGCVPSTLLVSVGRDGQPGNGASSDPQVGPPLADFYGHEQHGRFVAFVSRASNLVEGDTNGVSDVFLRDLCRGEPGCSSSTVRVSVTNSGGQIARPSFSPDFLRWDGEVVPFVTDADGVVPGDANGVEDVYVRLNCPVGASSSCRANTSIVSVGAGATLGDRASFAPRLNHDPWGVWVAAFLSEATNLLSGPPRSSNYACIYLTEVF